jgi:hypothetical protein
LIRLIGKSRSFLSIVILCLLVIGCSKEKAKALQEAALKLDEVSIAATTIVTEWRNVGVRPGGRLTTLEQQYLKAAMALIEGDEPGRVHVPTKDEIEQRLESIIDNNSDRQIAGLKRLEIAAQIARKNTENLHKSYLFAGKPLKSMKEPLGKVAASYYNLSKRIQDIPLTWDPIEMASIIRLAKSANSESEIHAEVTTKLASLIADRENQNAIRGRAVNACLEASQQALALVDMIENYENISAQDLLSIVGDFAPLSTILTRGEMNAEEFTERISSIESKAQELGIDLSGISVKNSGDDDV